MVKKSKSARYGVTLEQALPTSQPASFVVARSFDHTLKTVDELVAACEAPVQPKSEPHEQVQRMQLISTMQRLCELARRKGVSPERLADKDCDVWHGRFKDCGHVQKKLKGRNPPNPATLIVFNQQLAKLCPVGDPMTSRSYEAGDEYENRIDIDYNQALWRALLMEPISGVAIRLYCAHEKGGEDSLLIERKNLIAGLPEAFSECVTPGFASWEYLASCIVLMREFAEQGKTDFAKLVARTVCNLLIMLGPEFQARGIGAAMFNYCCEHILPIGGINVQPICLARASALLNTLPLAAHCKSTKVEVSWGVRRYLMACVLLRLKKPALRKVCDPQNYVDSYPAPGAWKQILKKKIKMKPGRYPVGRCVLDLERLLLEQPRVKTWAVPVSHVVSAVPVVVTPQQARSIWDGLGSRDLIS